MLITYKCAKIYLWLNISFYINVFIILQQVLTALQQWQNYIFLNWTKWLHYDLCIFAPDLIKKQLIE